MWDVYCLHLISFNTIWWYLYNFAYTITRCHYIRAFSLQNHQYRHFVKASSQWWSLCRCRRLTRSKMSCGPHVVHSWSGQVHERSWKIMKDHERSWKCWHLLTASDNTVPAWNSAAHFCTSGQACSLCSFSSTNWRCLRPKQEVFSEVRDEENQETMIQSDKGT